MTNRRYCSLNLADATAEREPRRARPSRRPGSENARTERQAAKRGGVDSTVPALESEEAIDDGSRQVPRELPARIPSK